MLKVARAMHRIALVHDYLLVLRGAERTFAAMADIWPDAPLFTLLYDEEGTQGRFAGRSVTTSGLQRLGARQRNFRVLLPFFQTAVRRLDLSGFDCVVSSSSAFAHGVQRPSGATHVCFCHAPFRYAWHERETALAEVPAAVRPALALALRRHRAFDRRALETVDQLLATGEIARDRIRRLWGRDATVLHPPVEVDRFEIGEAGEHVLFVGELVRHKRPQLAIEAAGAAGRPIKVVGTGPELGRLRARYAGSAEFLGRVDDEALARLYANAAALVVPNVEEFGIAAVEAQAAGRPVVAVDAGGVRETVVSGRTGVLVPDGEPAALSAALKGDLNRFDPQEVRANALRFRPQVFRDRLLEVVERARRR
jgi:glycosyltransferase involved in cell wall biosynthesis